MLANPKNGVGTEYCCTSLLVSAREGLISLAALRRVNQNVPLNPVAIGIFCQKPSRVFRGGHYRNVSDGHRLESREGRMPPRFSRSRDNRIWSFVYVSPTRKNVTLFIVAIQAREGSSFVEDVPTLWGKVAAKARAMARVCRNLTNQRTDPVAMSVLDPIEVAEVEVWPARPQRQGQE